MRLHQLTDIDQAEIIVPFTVDEINRLWEDNEPRQRTCPNILGEINSNYSKSNRLNLIKRTSEILPQIVRDAPITGANRIYIDTN